MLAWAIVGERGNHKRGLTLATPRTKFEGVRRQLAPIGCCGPSATHAVAAYEIGTGYRVCMDPKSPST